MASTEIGPELYGQQYMSGCWRNRGCKMHWFRSSWELVLRADRHNESHCCHWILSTEYCPLFPVETTAMTLPDQASTCLIPCSSCKQVNSASHNPMSPEQAICELRKVSLYCVHKLPSRVCCKKQLVFGVGIFMEHLANGFQILPFNTFFMPYVLLYLSHFSNWDVKSWSTKSHSSEEGAWGANDLFFFCFNLQLVS